MLGLPDLYATQYPTPAPFTPGSWDTMDQASYNNNGRTPALYSSFERYALGWVEPTEITGTLNGKLNPLADANECYVINTANSGEYFILENRQQKGWDKYIPGHGMLIWHIDYLRTIWDRNSCSNNANHQYVDIEEADNIKTEATRDGDAFPGSANVTSFGDNTTPSMVTWTSQRLNMPITDIKESALRHHHLQGERWRESPGHHSPRGQGCDPPIIYSIMERPGSGQELSALGLHHRR